VHARHDADVACTCSASYR